jgi:hypothetical protein
MPDNDQDKPQDIVCSGGIKLNFGAIFGPKDDDKNGDGDDE